MSEFILDEFMIPLGLTVQDVSEQSGVSITELQAVLNNEQEMTPEMSTKLGNYFGISAMMFYNIQQDLKKACRSERASICINQGRWSKKMTINNIFEQIKRFDEDGQEYWNSRELASALGYVDYRNFGKVIESAKEACKNSSQTVLDHFVDLTEMVQLGSGAERPIKSTLLSRYACYLIVQSADPRKEAVALGHSYFAIQTRRQELEDNRRLQLRQEIKEHNKSLASAAKQAGVIEPIDYAIFQNSGYKGLYGGLTQQDIKRKKGLKKSQEILDHMGSEELAANLFRATQTEAKLRHDGIHTKQAANETHYKVGQRIRETIAEFGNTMPENLPTPSESIKQLERRKKNDGNYKELNQ